MNIKKLAGMAAGALVTTGLMIGAVSPAMAADLSHDSIAGPVLSTTSYTDHDIVAFFIDGSGPIADANPGVAEKIGFPNGPRGLTATDIDDITVELTTANPNFHTEVTDALTSKDPFLVEAGLEAFEDVLSDVRATDDDGLMVGACAVNPIVFIDVALAVAALAVYDTTAAWQENTWPWEAAVASSFGTQELSAFLATNI